MKYVMVTNWENHWNDLRNNKTQYSLGMLKSGVDPSRLPESAETIFVKLRPVTKAIEKAWIGRTFDFRAIGNKIEFSVEIAHQIACPSQYADLSEGWYQVNDKVNSKIDLLPRFMLNLASTKEWRTFENDLYMLLKCIGINDAYKYEQTDQRGKADGYFSFGNLSVLYDCTLESNFENLKNVQISNFCDQLKKDKIEVKGRKITIGQHKKAVWIITQCRISRQIDQIDDVRIKEISVYDLIDLYVKRITSELDTEGLEEALFKIGLG
ncbi:hypothetical protein GSUET_14570 [Geobacter sulfurreducens subsp. ethanolicus]|uniref:hypothetical protein n=1 Tax=Geobacter sulfurreducens TaxID=35554 RepID=UPI0025737715|nr:hypothetical protein [Geobacter sulfurreducens]BEH09845.1 hypothetical protein GSUET_14570 [Geobacter sulfurreducens subsp. ethanolicus]